MKKVFISGMFVISTLALSLSLHAQEIKKPEYRQDASANWGVQVGVFTAHENASQFQNALQESRSVEASIQSQGGKFQVIAGVFNTFPDAWVVREALRDAGVEANVTTYIGEQQAAISLAPYSAGKSLFALAPGALKQSELRNLKGVALYEDLEAQDLPGNELEYGKALRSALTGAAVDDPIRGYILANLGSLELKAGNLAEAREHLIAVARGLVPSARAHRLMAMRRYAWVVHQLGDRLTAYRAYCEIMEQTDDSGVLATCEVERAGLLFELAESGKGSHQEVRREIAKAWDRIGGETEKTQTAHATLELMLLETYARQPEPDLRRAATLGEEFVARWEAVEGKKPLREIGSAMYQTGMNHRRAGNETRAFYWYERALAEIPEEAPVFKGYHPHAQSMVGLAHLATSAKNYSLSEQICRDIIELFPNDEITRKIRESDPGLETRVQPSRNRTGAAEGGAQ